MIEIETRRSTEFSDQEIAEIYSLFEDVFHKKREVGDFKAQFFNTSLGYSFHAIARENGKIVGHNVYVPFKYLYNDKTFLLCLSMDAMIAEQARGKGLYRKLLKACERLAVSEGCCLRIGFPNDNSYPLQVNVFKYHDIGKLNTYCLPLKVSAFLSKMSFFDWLSVIFSKGLLWLSSILPSSSKKHSYPFQKDRSDFDSFRYKWFGGHYQTIEKNGMKCIYKIDIFKGVKAAFLIDVWPLSKRNFDLAVREVTDKVKTTVPFILYVGNLPFTPLSLVKIPNFAAPKTFHFVGKILDKDFFKSEEEVFNIKNWDLNLSNYDLI